MAPDVGGTQHGAQRGATESNWVTPPTREAQTPTLQAGPLVSYALTLISQVRKPRPSGSIGPRSEAQAATSVTLADTPSPVWLSQTALG